MNLEQFKLEIQKRTGRLVELGMAVHPVSKADEIVIRCGGAVAYCSPHDYSERTIRNMVRALK